jgi:6-phosphofructokinase 1
MIARRYMLRLRKDDFEDPSELAKFASVLGISLDEFQEKFSYLVEDEPVPRRFFTSDDTSGLASSRA